MLIIFFYNADYHKYFYEKDVAKRAEIMKSLTETSNPRYLKAFEGILVANGGKYFVGKSLTWVDILVAHTLQSIKLDLGNYPALQNHMHAFHELPKIKEWIQKRPDTEY